MGHRGLPQRNQAVLRSRAVSGKKGDQADQPHIPLTESIHPPRDQQRKNRQKLVRVEDIHHTRRSKILPDKPHLHTRTKRVTPTVINKVRHSSSSLCSVAFMTYYPYAVFTDYV